MTLLRPALLASWIVFCLLSYSAKAGGSTGELRIESQPEFRHVRLTEVQGRIHVQGQLVDDAGDPLSRVPLHAEASGKQSNTPFIEICSEKEAPVSEASAPKIRTDPAGQFCISVPASLVSSQRLHISYLGSDFQLSAETDIQLTPSFPEASLHFDGPTVEIDLGKTHQRIAVELRPSGPATASHWDSFPVVLELLTGGKVRTLGTKRLPPSAVTVEFEIPTRDLGAPGPATIVARSTAAMSKPPTVRAIALKRVLVDLTHGRIRRGGPNGTATVNVIAATSSGLVPEGHFRVLLNGNVVDKVKLASGAAQVSWPHDSNENESVEIQFVSAMQWWRAASSLRLNAVPPGAAPLELPDWPWLLLLGGVLFSFRPARQKPLPAKASVRPPADGAKPESPLPSGAAPLTRPPALPNALPNGFCGAVRDAHSGKPISGAEVRARIPSFVRPDRTIETTTDRNGLFSLPDAETNFPSEAELTICAPEHSPLNVTFARGRYASVTLTSRRRHLLARLVHKASSYGLIEPNHSGAPTPTRILHAARRRNLLQFAVWAQRVRSAAYGPTRLDAASEQRVLDEEPDPRSLSSPPRASNR